MSKRGHTGPGDVMMKNSKEILSSILKTTQMGQVGIRSVLPSARAAAFRGALESQLREYDAIETEAHNIAARRGWVVEELPKSTETMADLMSRTRLTVGCTDSRIAAMMVQGNTRGMIKGLKNLHRFDGGDQPVRQLGEKLLKCEDANIRQMHPYL